MRTHCLWAYENFLFYELLKGVKWLKYLVNMVGNFAFLMRIIPTWVTHPADTREERTAAKRRVLRRNRAPQILMAAAVMSVMSELQELDIQELSTPVLTLSLCQCGNGPLRPMGGADPSVEWRHWSAQSVERGEREFWISNQGRNKRIPQCKFTGNWKCA